MPAIQDLQAEWFLSCIGPAVNISIFFACSHPKSLSRMPKPMTLYHAHPRPTSGHDGSRTHSSGNRTSSTTHWKSAYSVSWADSPVPQHIRSRRYIDGCKLPSTTIQTRPPAARTKARGNPSVPRGPHFFTGIRYQGDVNITKQDLQRQHNVWQSQQEE